jgi:dephospho-CoA kinase
MRVIGVTGTIGSGKSTVLRWLADLGARTVDADALVRRLYESDGELQAQLRAAFGPQVVAGTGVDRDALRRALDRPGALAELERIVHPAVQRARDALLDAARREGAPAFAFEAIKLVESGSSSHCDELWIVVAPPAVQLARLAARGVEGAEARRRLAWQGSVDTWTDAFLAESERLGRAGRPVVVLDNGGSEAVGQAAVRRLWSGLGPASSPAPSPAPLPAAR